MAKFSFLLSNRFWALVLGSASTVMVNNWGTEEWYISLGRFFGLLSVGFIGIKTVDRSVELVAGASVLNKKGSAVPVPLKK